MNAGIVSLIKRPKSQVGRISRSREIGHNAWVISGTRISVAAIKRLHEDGFDNRAIIEEYPDLTLQDVEAALKHKDAKAA